jgi:hypothetical protein
MIVFNFWVFGLHIFLIRKGQWYRYNPAFRYALSIGSHIWLFRNPISICRLDLYSNVCDEDRYIVSLTYFCRYMNALNPASPNDIEARDIIIDFFIPTNGNDPSFDYWYFSGARLSHEYINGTSECIPDDLEVE